MANAATRWCGANALVVQHSIDVNTPGPRPVDLGPFEFNRLRRPIDPLDPNTH